MNAGNVSCHARRNVMVLPAFMSLKNSVKVELKLPLCLTKHHAMKAYWWSGGTAPHILDLGTRWR
jgi:hypothetical protein